MSSAGIAIAPMAVVAAAGAASLVTGTAAALIAVHGAEVAATEAGEALARVDGGARVGGERSAAASRPTWERLAAEVAHMNARIAMLSDRVARAGTAAVVMPKPLSIAGCTRAAAAQWVGDTVREMRAVQQRFETAVAEGEIRKIAERVGGPAVPYRDTAVITTCQTRLTARQAAGAGTAPPAECPPTTVERAAELLDCLDLEADERERRDVLAAVALIDRHREDGTGSYVAGLRQTVAAVNRAVGRRRLAALRLVALDGAAAVGIEPQGPLRGTAVRLRVVVAGDDDLTPHLHAESAQAVEQVKTAARRRFLLETVRERLAAYGCAVQTEYDMEHSASLRINRPEWSGEHFADVWVQRNGDVRSEILRRHALDDVQAVARERSRCLGHNAMMRELGAELGASVDVDDAHEPQFIDDPGAALGDAVPDRSDNPAAGVRPAPHRVRYRGD